MFAGNKFFAWFQQFSIFNFPAHVLKPLTTVPKAPVIIGIIASFLHFQTFSISLFNVRYHSTFYCFFSVTQVSNGHATFCGTIMWHSCVSLSTVMMSGLLCTSLWLVCTEKFRSIFALTFSSTHSGVCSYHLVPVGNLHLLLMT